jgi:flagellar basal-body rod protein FlgC
MPGPINPSRRASLMPFQGEQVVRPMFRSLGISASGLSAQRQRLETIAQNIANADVTRGPDGGPYKRRDVVLETATSQNALFPGPGPFDGTGSGGMNVSGTNGARVPTSDGPVAIEVPVLPMNGNGAGVNGEFGVRVAGIAEDQGEGRLVYEPGHPDADADGYVRYPDVNTTMETARMLDAKRLYEANASVFQVAKSILRASLDI